MVHLSPLRCDVMSSGELTLSADELARVSIALVDVDGVTRFENRSKSQCYAASIMKLAVAVAVLRELDAGRLSPDDRLVHGGSFASGFDGSRFTIDDDSIDHELCVASAADEFTEGVEVFPAHWVRRDSPASSNVSSSSSSSALASDSLGSLGSSGFESVSVARALRRSITVSSNEGANLLMQRVGLEAVNLVLLDAGCEHTVVERMVFDVAARDAGRTNTLTALDSAQLMWSIRFGTIASDESLTYLCEVLCSQTQRSMIPFALEGAIASGEVVVGNKEGQTDEVLHDVAFIEPVDSDTFVLAVCTVGLSEDEARVAVRNIATYAYENRRSWSSLADNFR